MSAKKSYRAMKQELEALIAWFEQGNVDIDEVAVKYAQAKKCIAELETHLGELAAQMNKE